MSRLPIAVLFAAVVCAACAKQEEASSQAPALAVTAAQTDAAVTVGEQRLETLAEVISGLRDRHPQARYPTREEVEEAAAVQHPGMDLMNDGWGRPFVYDVGADGMSFRVYSLGANGTDNNGTLDDYPQRSRSMTIN